MRFFGRTRTPWEGDFPLTRRRIYVLPSRMGLIFAGALLVMLVLTINYGLALGYVLVFVLGGVFWVSLFHAWRNLAGLVLRPGRGDPVHAGETAELNLSFLNPTRLARYAIRLDTGRDTEAQEVDIAAEAEQMVSVALKTEKRGWQPAPLLRLTSDFPLGLWRVWTGRPPRIRPAPCPSPMTPPAMPSSTSMAAMISATCAPTAPVIRSGGWPGAPWPVTPRVCPRPGNSPTAAKAASWCSTGSSFRRGWTKKHACRG